LIKAHRSRDPDQIVRLFSPGWEIGNDPLLLSWTN
jgi:hypothetical protein